MAKANAELSAKKRFEPKLPDHPFVSGIATFLQDPAAILNLLTAAFWTNMIANLGPLQAMSAEQILTGNSVAEELSALKAAVVSLNNKVG